MWLIKNKYNCFYVATLNWCLWSNQQTQHVLQKCHVFFRRKFRCPNISSVDIVHATSLNNSGNYVFTAYVGTLSSTYTNISTMTTHSFFIYPSLNTTTGSHNMMKFIYISRTDQNLLSGGNFPFFATLPSLGDPSSLSINQILHWKSGFVLILLYQEGPLSRRSSTLANDTYCSISTPSANQVLRHNSSYKGAFTNLVQVICLLIHLFRQSCRW